MCFSTTSFGSVDVHHWCQVELDRVRTMTAVPVAVLEDYREQLSKADTIESMAKLMSISVAYTDESREDELKFIGSLVDNLQAHQNISRAEAEKNTLTLIKQLKIKSVNSAIIMHDIKSPSIWAEVFDKCVLDNTTEQ